MSGKGSKRRPQQISDDELAQRWAMAFSKRESDMSVIDEIAAERKRQIEDEGWTSEHDDEHGLGELVDAAACYALQSNQDYPEDALLRTPLHWPWGWQYWKPKNPRRDLIRAAALIVAEIERRDRAQQ